MGEPPLESEAQTLLQSTGSDGELTRLVVLAAAAASLRKAPLTKMKRCFWNWRAARTL